MKKVAGAMALILVAIVMVLPVHPVNLSPGHGAGARVADGWPLPPRPTPVPSLDA